MSINMTDDLIDKLTAVANTEPNISSHGERLQISQPRVA